MVYSESKRLCFCPDRLLVFESNQVRGVDYSDVVVRIGRSTCIEDEDVPVDARIVGQTWLYLRPDGSPERGYGGNRRYPVAEYADITIAAPCGVNELFQCSDPMGADDLAVALRHLGLDAELDDVASEDRYERAPDGDRYSDSARSETGTADAESDPATLYEAALRLLVENRFTTTAALGEALGIDGARAEALVSELAFDGYIVWEEIPDRFRPTRAATRYIELLNRARSSDDPRDRRSRRTRQGGPRWHHRDGSRRHGTGRRATSSDRSPYDVLGVATGSSRDEISAAYHLLAQMYHPDKVANLGPEFQMLAEQRMKEINAAYRALTAGVKQ